MKKLSIIIPCYNVEQYISRCYKSLANQNNADDVEFIFINDGSNDRTLELLQEIEAKDNRVVIINQNNKGVSVARNSALEIIQGEYVYLLDADDYLTVDSIYAIKRIIDNYKPDIILTAYNISRNGIEKFKSLSIKSGMYDKVELFSEINCFPTSPKLVYRSNIINDKKLYFLSSVKCGEVYAFTMNYMKYANNVYVMDIPIFNYFMRNDSAIHKPNYQNDITVIKALSSIYDDGEELVNYGSFITTAFKLLCSFSYKKYLKYTSFDTEAIEAIKIIFSNQTVKRCVKDTLFKPHKLIFERLLALYIYMMPITFGFKLLNYLIKKK